ncbi:MAG: DUF378 domain-containing protein [Candidatus Pacebacteria bacterium]|nr:DUF378 domain-containing protein [Candidatus Paceibacterota bacterium]
MNSVTKVLLIIGGLDLGIIGIGNLINKNLDIISLFKAFHPLIPTIIYCVIGIAATYSMFRKY